MTSRRTLSGGGSGEDMNLYKSSRGVPGALECVCCFERDCFGCALTAPPIGVWPVCGQDVLIGYDYEWRGDEMVHCGCLDEIEGGGENWE